MIKLYLKHLAVDTPITPIGERLRWIANMPQRVRHPELWDLYLEDRRIGLALTALIGSEDNCVDVGAHIGSVLARMRRLAPNGSHVAIEPTPAKARWLRKKFADVEIVEAATGEEPGVAVFYDDLDRPGFSGLMRPVNDSTVRSYEVQVVRLDDLLEQSDRIDFLKIDVEGAELSTLRGADAVLARHKPVVLFECGPEAHIDRFDYKRADLFHFFGERGYELYSIVDFVFGRHPMTLDWFDKAGTYPYRGFNYLAVPAGTHVERLL